MARVRLNKDNKINEGIMGYDDYTATTPNRGLSDRSIGDEFFRTGRNSGMDVIEAPEYGDSDELTDDDYEDMGYDYDGGDEEMDGENDDDAGYAYHPELRSQLYKINQRLVGIEDMVANLFGSQGTPTRPKQ